MQKANEWTRPQRTGALVLGVTAALLVGPAEAQQVMFDSTSSETQSWCVPVSTRDAQQTERVVVLCVEGDDVAFLKPYGTLRVRSFDANLANGTAPISLNFDCGNLDAATNQYITEGYVLAGWDNYSGSQPEPQVRLLNADGTPAGTVLALAAPGGGFQSVAEGNYQTSQGFKQGWFSCVRESGDMTIRFHWHDSSSSSGSNLATELVNSLAMGQFAPLADIRTGAKDAAMIAIRNGSKKVFSASTSAPATDYLIDSVDMTAYIAAIRSPTAGYRSAAWAWWNEGVGYHVYSIGWRDNGKPVAVSSQSPFRDHGLGFQPHMDRSTLVWMTENPVLTRTDLVYWREGGTTPPSGTLVEQMPNGSFYGNHMEPSVTDHPAFSHSYVGWCEEHGFSSRTAYVERF